MEQRAIDHIGMANDPAHIGSRPIDISGFNSVDIFHAPLKGYSVTSVITNDALWSAGGA